MRPETKRKVMTTFQGYLLNPVTKLVAGTFPGWVLLETTGRVSGKPRRTPLGGTRDGDTFWAISEQGRHANWVKNIVARPNIRMRVGGRWRTGTAHILDDDDVQARLKAQSRWNRSAVKMAGTDLLTVRFDLDQR
jgi:deazaflavin-dependent oxidoreductase (nitroreductase family)